MNWAIKRDKDPRKFWCADLSGNTGTEWYLNAPTDSDGNLLYFSAEKRFSKDSIFQSSVYKSGALVDVTFTLNGIVIVNDKALGILQEVCPNDIAVYPVAVKDCPIPLYALECVNVADCLDMKRSNATKWKKGEIVDAKVGSFKGVHPLTIEVSRVPQGVHTFRIKGYDLPWIVSEHVRERLVNAGITGVAFTPVN